jgi:hypothetical protein
LGINAVFNPDLENAELPILVTEAGIVTLSNAEQPRNAELPILVTELPNVTLVNLSKEGTLTAGIEVIVEVYEKVDKSVFLVKVFQSHVKSFP